MKICLVLCDALRYDRVNPHIMPNLTKLSLKGVKHTMHYADGGTTKWSLPYMLSGQRQYDPKDNFPAKLTANGIHNMMIHSNAVLVNEKYQECFKAHIDVGVEMAPLKTGLRNTLRKTSLWKQTRGIRKHFVDSIEIPYRRAKNILDVAQRELDKRDGFYWIHLMDPHIPYNPPGLSEEEKAEANTLYEMVLKAINTNKPPENDLKNGLIRLYDLECRYMDQCISNFVENNLDTLFIFTSDHGEMFGENKSYSHGPHYHGMTLQLGHVPLIVYGPGVAPQTVVDYTASIDIGSTILDLYGLDVTQGYGKSMRSDWL